MYSSITQRIPAYFVADMLWTRGKINQLWTAMQKIPNQPTHKAG